MNSTSILSAEDLDQLRKASRWAAVLSALGAVIVIGALLLASYQLSQIQTKKMQATTELDQKRLELQRSQKDLEQERLELKTTRASLSQAQCALRESRSAIEAFHQRNYDVAIQLYYKALACDPQNAYLLNLEAYSLFKANRVGEAIDAQEQSLRVDPTYAWGYFDLARFFCAASAYDKAANARSTAIRLRPELAEVMASDGEFTRLCAPILK